MTPRIFSTTLFFFLLVWLVVAQNAHPAWRNYTTDHGLPSPEVHYCLEGADGYMYFGTDNGLSRFDGYHFRNYGPREGLRNNVVFDLQEDRHGCIWMMTHSGNVYYHL